MLQDDAAVSLNNLPPELGAGCLQWLSAKDLASISTVCKDLKTLAEDLWDAVLERECSGLGLELRRRRNLDDESHHRMLHATSAARQAELVSELSCATWTRLEFSFGRTPPAQEGHSSVLLDGRWWVVINGFTQGGVDNRAQVCDTWALEQNEPLAWRAVQLHRPSAATPVVPRRKYGHTACALGPGHLALLGGVRFGGYSGDVSDCHVLTLSRTDDPTLKSRCGVGAEGVCRQGECCTRGYCSLLMCRLRYLTLRDNSLLPTRIRRITKVI